MSGRRVTGSFPRIGIGQAEYMRAIFAVAWDTGLRRADILALPLDQLLSRGRFTVIQRKSSSVKVCSINESTREWIRDTLTRESRDLAFPLWAGVEQLVRVAKHVMRSAGLTSNRHHVFHKIRRSSITHVESLCTGAGWLHGGHSNPAITAKHYIDRSAVYDKVPTPESLD